MSGQAEPGGVTFRCRCGVDPGGGFAGLLAHSRACKSALRTMRGITVREYRDAEKRVLADIAAGVGPANEGFRDRMAASLLCSPDTVKRMQLTLRKGEAWYPTLSFDKP